MATGRGIKATVKSASETYPKFQSDDDLNHANVVNGSPHNIVSWQPHAQSVALRPRDLNSFWFTCGMYLVPNLEECAYD